MQFAVYSLFLNNLCRYEINHIKSSPGNVIDISSDENSNSISNALKIAIEADKLIFIQFMIHLFATLNMLIENIVPNNMKTAIRSQCILAIIFNKYLDIMRLIRPHPSRDLAPIDQVTSDMLRNTKFLQ